MTLITEPFIGGWWQTAVEDHIAMGEEKEFRILSQEEFDWIFRGIPFGATIGMNVLWDKSQPKREAKGKKPGFHINFYNNISIEDETFELQCRLQPSHGGVEAQRLLCDRVEFGSYYLEDRLREIK